MNIATLGVAIDPGDANRGRDAIVKALSDIAKAAEAASKAVEQTSKATGTAAAASGQAQATAHTGMLSKMAESIRNFFGAANSSAQQTHGIFAGMVGKVVGFLQQTLSLVPGATGMFAGLTGAVGGAATGLAGMAAGGTAAMIALGALVGLVVGVTAALVALGIAAAFTWKAIGAAADAEKLEVQYTVLIGNVEKTKKVMAELREFADVTPFDTKGVMQWGQELLNAGIKAEDLKSTLHDLGNSALGDSQKMTTAVLVLGQAIGKMKVDTMDLRQLGAAGIPIMEGLQKVTGKTSAQVLDMTTKGLIGFKQLRAAFADLGGEGGRLGDMMDKMSQTWEGKISTIQSRWDNLLIAFGRPILDAVKPALDALDARLIALIPTAQRLGNAIAGAVISSNWDEVWTFVRAKFDAAATQMAADFGTSIKDGLVQAFKEAVEMLKHDIADIGAAFHAIIGATGGPSTGPSTGDVMGLQIPGRKTVMVPSGGGLDMSDTVIPATSNVGYDQPIGPGLNGPNEVADAIFNRWKQTGEANVGKGFDWSGLKEPLRTATDGDPVGKTPKVKASDIFHGDAYYMEQFRKQMAQMQALMQAGKMSGTEFGHRSEDLKNKTAGELADPKLYAAALDKWRTFKAEQERIGKETDERIKNGQAGMFESFGRGMQKAADQWGNMSQQMEKLGTGIANSISTNMTNAFTAMVTGSKSAGEAFRDMAVGILNDIAKMIIQLLVELAVRTAIKAISGYATGGSVGGGASDGMSAADFSKASGHATGGTVWGGRGGIDDIPAWLTAGEYVIPKDAAQFYGTRFLDSLREKRAHRYAEGGMVAASQARHPIAHTNNAGGDINVSFSVHVGGGDSQESETDKRKRAENMSRRLEAMAKRVVQEELRNGGSLSRRGH